LCTLLKWCTDVFAPIGTIQKNAVSPEQCSSEYVPGFEVIHAKPLLHQLQWLPMQQRSTQVNSSDVSLQDSQHSSTPVYPFSRIIESACSRTLPSRCWSNRSQDRLFLPCFLVFSTVSTELAAVNSPDQRLFVNVYRASAYNACRARYCYGKSVRLSACLSNASSVSKRIDTSSHFFDILVGESS